MTGRRSNHPVGSVYRGPRAPGKHPRGQQNTTPVAAPRTHPTAFQPTNVFPYANMTPTIQPTAPVQYGQPRLLNTTPVAAPSTHPTAFQHTNQFPYANVTPTIQPTAQFQPTNQFSYTNTSLTPAFQATSQFSYTNMTLFNTTPVAAPSTHPTASQHTNQFPYANMTPTIQPTAQFQPTNLTPSGTTRHPLQPTSKPSTPTAIATGTAAGTTPAPNVGGSKSTRQQPDHSQFIAKVFNKDVQKQHSKMRGMNADRLRQALLQYIDRQSGHSECTSAQLRLLGLNKEMAKRVAHRLACVVYSSNSGPLVFSVKNNLLRRVASLFMPNPFRARPAAGYGAAFAPDIESDVNFHYRGLNAAGTLPQLLLQAETAVRGLRQTGYTLYIHACHASELPSLFDVGPLITELSRRDNDFSTRKGFYCFSVKDIGVDHLTISRAVLWAAQAAAFEFAHQRNGALFVLKVPNATTAGYTVVDCDTSAATINFPAAGTHAARYATKAATYVPPLSNWEATVKQCRAFRGTVAADIALGALHHPDQTQQCTRCLIRPVTEGLQTQQCCFITQGALDAVWAAAQRYVIEIEISDNMYAYELDDIARFYGQIPDGLFNDDVARTTETTRRTSDGVILRGGPRRRRSA